MHANFFQPNSILLHLDSEETHVFFSNFIQVDVAILEVGLGGKYDATNVVCIIVLQRQYAGVLDDKCFL